MDNFSTHLDNKKFYSSYLRKGKKIFSISQFTELTFYSEQDQNIKRDNKDKKIYF